MMAGEWLETATPLMWCACGGAEMAIPPPINATEGIAAQILRQGTVNVFEGPLFDMLLPKSTRSGSTKAAAAM
jgi:hypothetical protein